jgi:hypothetical protein
VHSGGATNINVEWERIKILIGDHYPSGWRRIGANKHWRAVLLLACYCVA